MSDNLLNRKAYYYDLPEELIAQHPLKNRGESRLMMINRKDKTIEHRKFSDIIDYLNPGDVLVINTTKVIPARLYGRKETGGSVEILLITPKTENEWVCLVKPGKKLKTGHKVIISEELSAEIIDYLDDGTRLVRFVDGNDKPVMDFMSLLNKYGEIPLPPYIDRKIEDDDKENYQTVYAKHDGSVAAPTAGLHFTEELLDKIRNKGVIITEVILNVGLGTFRPVEVDNITEHKMHSELCVIPKETADIINNAKQNGKKIISVGTTSTRTMESFAEGTHLGYGTKWTDIFIYEGKKFNIVDAQITNFHTPESTLLMMICAFGGYELMMRAYQKAVEERYRFFSYGDAMVIF